MMVTSGTNTNKTPRRQRPAIQSSGVVIQAPLSTRHEFFFTLKPNSFPTIKQPTFLIEL